MHKFDYIIVGAGSAGCVMANKLSENSDNQVLLIEAGPIDKSMMIHMPKGIGKLLFDTKHVWQYEAQLDSAPHKEVWVRGKTLGGSSSINGMMYNRGQPEDYDQLEQLGCTGWNWQTILPYMRQMERHELGPNEWRGGKGELKVSMPGADDPFYHATIKAGEASGLNVVEDVNGSNGKGVIGLMPRTISLGKRQSSAQAFLRPAEQRDNLTIYTSTKVGRVLFDGNVAIGVQCTGAHSGEWLASKEVILCAGGIVSPQLLQVSGVGPADVLSDYGIAVVSDVEQVGQNLLEHRVLSLQFRMNSNISHNQQYTGWRLVKNIINYLTTNKGYMASGAYEVGAFVRALQDSTRPDAQLLIAPYSIDPAVQPIGLEKEPGMSVLGYILRPESQGQLKIQSPSMDVAPLIQPRYLTADYDQKVAINIARYIRQYVSHSPLAELLVGESDLSAGHQSDSEILELWHQQGGCGYHLVGTCRMGSDKDAVVNPRLQVKGTCNLRVMDCSVLPFMVSGNTNAPMMAMAHYAAAMITADNQHDSYQ